MPPEGWAVTGWGVTTAEVGPTELLEAAGEELVVLVVLVEVCEELFSSVVSVTTSVEGAVDSLRVLAVVSLSEARALLVVLAAIVTEVVLVELVLSLAVVWWRGLWWRDALLSAASGRPELGGCESAPTTTGTAGAVAVACGGAAAAMRR